MVELMASGAWHGGILGVSRDAPALSAWPVSLSDFLGLWIDAVNHHQL